MIIYGHGELFMFINWTKAVDVFCYTWLLCYFVHLVVLWLLGHSNARGSLTKNLCVSLLTPGGAKKKPEKLVPRSINIPDPFELITTYPPCLLNQWIKQWMITQTNISPIGIKFFSWFLLFDFIPPKKKHSSPFPASKVRFILFHPAKTVTATWCIRIFVFCFFNNDLAFLWKWETPWVAHIFLCFLKKARQE